MAAEKEAGVEKEVEEGANQNPAPIDKDDECRRQEVGWSQATLWPLDSVSTSSSDSSSQSSSDSSSQPVLVGVM